MNSSNTTTDLEKLSLDLSSPAPSLCYCMRHWERETRTHLRLLLAIFFFITLLVIISELVLSYPRTLISFVLPEASRRQLELAAVKLEILEWHTRVQASALACSAFVFSWYKLFIRGFRLLVRFGRFVGFVLGWNDSASWVRVENPNTNVLGRVNSCRCLCSMGNELKGKPFHLRPYVSYLLTIIIINDSIYNRYRDLSLSSMSSAHIASSSPDTILLAYSHMHNYLSIILPGAIIRFKSMLFRTFFICAAEISVLSLILYLSGLCTHRSTTQSSISGSSALFRSENNPSLPSTELITTSSQNSVSCTLRPVVLLGKDSEPGIPFEEAKLAPKFSSDGLPRYTMHASSYEPTEDKQFIPTGTTCMCLEQHL
ncbi:hypothetical protein F5879DRAFT_962432 [Lentinula edodes]|nr:hypothetical protein F5879DRAFT_962432 [Lentinula edodes]